MRVVIDTVGVQTVYQLLQESVRITRNMLSLTCSWVSSKT